eukprot:TRINITY_DN6293_c1_g1_i1.p1 TRINITY_DN6293_c1_g1~~TRINITY_DN6293_c1_g1_i1.p1  ORF type:complete len:505 (+),score=100.30 TRINITY_DN6293_c1_g1_i1:323-1837(+)
MDEEDSLAYLKCHGIATLIGRATTAMTQERPAEPKRWLANRLRGGSVDMPGAEVYLKNLGIGDLVDKAVAELVKVKPEDPRVFLSDYVMTYDLPAGRRPSSQGNVGQQQQQQQQPPALRGVSLDDTSKREQFKVSFAAFEETRYTGSDFESSMSDSLGQPPQDGNNEETQKHVEVSSKYMLVHNAVEELKSHLMGTPWTDVYSGMEGYLKDRKENIEAGDAQPSDEPIVDSSDEEDDRSVESGVGPTAAEGVIQTMQVLRDCIAGYKRGEVAVEIHVIDDCAMGGFNTVVEQVRELAAGQGDTPDVKVELKSFPIRKRFDSFRSMHREVRVLMWAQLCVSKKQSALTEEQNFEIFVNLIGSTTYRDGAPPKEDFDYLEVIPSFGQLVNVLQPAQHKDLCNPDSVVRAKRMAEALYHFKLCLVRVAEHIIHSVVEGEFLTNVSKRFDEVGISTDAQIFKRLAGRRQSTSDLRRPSRALDETIAEKARRRQSAPSVARERFFDTLR